MRGTSKWAVVALTLLGLLAGAWGLRVAAGRPAAEQAVATTLLGPSLNHTDGLFTPTPTVTDTPAPVATVTPRPSPTSGGPTVTPTVTGTPGSCRADFRDVAVEYWAYGYIQWIYCNNIAQGYTCGAGCQEFRPEANTTRAQIAKLLTIGFALPQVTPVAPTFADVPPSNVFYPYVEAAAARGVFQGYACGGPGEPCPGVYFRPNNNVTRAQLSKVVVLAAGWALTTPGSPTFTDVPASYWAYSYIETAYQYDVVGGYDCLALTPVPTPSVACREFRPNYPASRAQISKMVYIAITPPLHERSR